MSAPSLPSKDEMTDALAAQADEKVREVFQRLPELRAEAIANVVKGLLGHADWRARAEGVKLRARIAGDFAPTEIADVSRQRAEDLGGMDDVLATIPKATLAALVAKTRERENGEE